MSSARAKLNGEAPKPLATGSEVIFVRRCIFHEGFAIQNKLRGMKMSLPPMATFRGAGHVPRGVWPPSHWAEA